MGIAETLDYIHNVKWQGSKPGLERTSELLTALSNPESLLKFVHIAGTNGKGSTAAMIASILQEAGYRTGLYISPYVTCFNERIQINGVYISDDELEGLTNDIRPFADAMNDPPTEFEMITALALKYFAQKKCDIVVLEVGLGGKLDSTNVIDTPEVAVITSIGFDHANVLGHTLHDIAVAKAGIIKNGGDVVFYGGETEVETVFENASKDCGARLHRVDFSRISQQVFSLGGVSMEFRPYGEIAIALTGAYQLKNAAVAITALEILRKKGYSISATDIVNGLACVRWQGRFELIGHDPVFILDGAHNPQGVKATADSLRSLFGERKVIFIVGVMADKDVDSMMGIIAPLAESFIAVRPKSPRAMDAQTLAKRLLRYGVPVYVCKTIDDGVSMAMRKAGKDAIICALGSLYFSAEIRAAYNSLNSNNCIW